MSLIIYCLIILICKQNVFSAKWTSNLNCGKANERLNDYQKVLTSKCEFFLILNQDSHKTFKIFEKHSTLALISGFSGAHGFGTIFQNRSILWTSFKYELQAKSQLFCGWELKIANNFYVQMSDWITENFGEGCKIKVNAWQISHQKLMFLESKNFRIEPLFAEENSNFQSSEQNEIYVHKLEHAGLSWREKVNLVMNKIYPRANTLLLDSLDDIAWTFNLRGSDLPFSPLFKAYAILTNHSINLFLDNPEQLSEEVRTHLEIDNCSKNLCITLKDYYLFIRDLSEWKNPYRKWILPEDTNHAICRYLTQENVIQMPSPVSLLKVKKNSIEIANMKKAHVFEGIALVKILATLEKDVKNAQTNWSEFKVAQKLQEERKNEPTNKGESFQTVSAFGKSGISMTYVPDNKTSRTITTDNIFFIHTGGQYKIGTTQIGRSFHFGTPSELQIEIYTKLLMGLIDFTTFVFPFGTKDIDLPDKLAIGQLYQMGLDYQFEIGHGIGYFLNFDEKPISLGSDKSKTGISLEEGMFISLEIGYFNKDLFGIILTNTMMVTKTKTKFGKNFLTFETVSMFPFDINLIQPLMLQKSHINWLNEYHAKVRDLIGHKLSETNIKEFSWLISKTEPIKKDNFPNCENLKINNLKTELTYKSASSKLIFINLILNILFLIFIIPTLKCYQKTF